MACHPMRGSKKPGRPPCPACPPNAVRAAPALRQPGCGVSRPIRVKPGCGVSRSTSASAGRLA
eukprot:433272-Prymnesium_polylepis.1